MEAILLDAAGTLFNLSEPLGTTYTRFGQKFGLQLQPKTVENAFRQAFQQAQPPHYSTSRDGHEIEKQWWKELVAQVTQLPPSPEFDRYFEQLFAHYAHPTAWKLYPDTLPFLEANQHHYRLAVVSNFD